MKILIAHNFYQQPGGEDAVFRAEAALLERHGHTVTRFIAHNDQIDAMSKMRVAASTLWNRSMQRRLRDVVRRERIDVAHFHNTFPLISPAAFGAARSAGAAVVQTLHNHRFVCSNGILYRDGHLCGDCLGHPVAWRGVLRGCYRGSRAATAVVALMQATHRMKRTWHSDIDAYIAPSESTRGRLCGSGLPASRVIVKPHFVDPDPGIGIGDERCAVFVGRLSEEKGLRTLLRAWDLLPRPPRLKIIGDGPLADLLRPAPRNVEWLGRLPMEAAYDQIGRAAALIMPSECHETFGRVIAEAYAKGTPVIATKLGAAPEMVHPGITGFLCEPGDAHDLAIQVERSFVDPNILAEMRAAARREYEAHYHADSNYDQLMAIYRRALESRCGGFHAHAQAGVHHNELGRWEPVRLTVGRTAGAIRDARHVLPAALVSAADDGRRAGAAA